MDRQQGFWTLRYGAKFLSLQAVTTLVTFRNNPDEYICTADCPLLHCRHHLRPPCAGNIAVNVLFPLSRSADLQWSLEPSTTRIECLIANLCIIPKRKTHKQNSPAEE